MLFVAVILYCLAMAGTAAMALKYGRGPVPVSYHRDIIGDPIPANVLTVLRVLYRVLGAALAALALAGAALALGPLAQGAVWAKFVIFATVLLVAVPSTMVPRQVEKATGVRTPWRVAAILLGVSALAFVLSVL
jgi:hypothetical protein